MKVEQIAWIYNSRESRLEPVNTCRDSGILPGTPDPAYDV
jgi:hypothetical protein